MAKQTVPVRILGQEYKIRSDADEDIIRRAAALVDETMARVRQRTGTVDTQVVAVLAALNIANHLIALRERGGVSGGAGAGPEQLGPLIEMVEALLVEGAAPTSH